MSTQPLPAVASLIDLALYPIHEAGSPRLDALVEDWAEEFQRTGACNMQGFLTAEGARELARESETLLQDAYEREWTVNFLYQSEVDPAFAADHPAQRFWHTGSTHIASDQFDNHSKLRALYEWDALTDLVARVQGKPRLYRFADEFQALNVIALGAGERTVWHHDSNECTITLLVQDCEAGGEFLYGHDTRAENGELHLDAITAVIDEDPAVVRSLPRCAGTLTLFRGGCSLHGVTPVVGRHKRLTAVLTYDPQPGRVGNDAKNASLYGPRVQRILDERRQQEPIR